MELTERSGIFHTMGLCELLQGPDLTNNLVGILLRFLQDPVAVMGDVLSMFHQVRVPVEDRGFLRFLWWPGGDLAKGLKEYQTTVHLFGAVSSSSCANFAMRRDAEDHQHEFSPEVVFTVLKNFYVDDCLKSLPSSHEAIKHVCDLRNLMNKGGFNLTKWVSNDRLVLESIPVEDRAKGTKELDLTCDVLPVERALGVSWFVEADQFGFKVFIKDRPCTRRGILSAVSSLYDPLGMAAPFILPAKLLLQDLCRRGLGWDDEVPDLHLTRWRAWVDDLPKISRIAIGRCVKPVKSSDITSCQIHHFCDASQVAYGAVSYLRLVDMQGRIFCSFLIGKSRLAPLKVTTIPRLELTAATVSVQLNKILTKELQIPIDKVTFWTDSMTVIRYIANESKRFHTYVANRVAFIREESSPSQWRYIDSKSNPADEASRGVTADVFVRNGRWLKGLDFLLTTESEWADHVQESAELTENDPEIKKEPKSFTVSVSKVYASIARIVKRFSSWMKLLKFIAMCLRCQRRFRLRKREPGPNGHGNVGALSLEPMSRQDLDFAERELIMFDQRNAFPEEIESIKKGGCVKKSSCLAKLSPVLIGGVLCVGGRLSRAPYLPDESRHQIIISKDSPLGVLLIRFFHEKNDRSWREYVLALLR